MPSKRNLLNLGKTKRGSTADSAKLKVKAIFIDYDGTISSIGAERSDSAVLPDNLILLKQIAQLIPVAVITTKDLPFVMPRTPFAYAWAGIAGLEIIIGKTLIQDFNSETNLPALVAVLKNAKHLSGHGLVIEEKLASDGATIAFSVDWRQAENNHDARQNALQILAESKKSNLTIKTYEKQPFFDVFPCSVNKGSALVTIKKKMELSNGILYMGDSALDNPAFQEADIGIGVMHQESSKNLLCDFYLRFEDVPDFLQALIKNNFWLDTKSPLFILPKQE